MEEVVKYLKVLVALEVQRTYGEDEERAKPEVVLKRAGLPVGEIASLLGKSVAAVQKTIERAK